MATYVYETIPAKRGAKSRQFEIQQSMMDAPLTKHPETGEPVRRVVMGGYGVMLPKAKAVPPPRCGCACGQERCCVEE